jgi:hypothetical protein
MLQRQPFHNGYTDESDLDASRGDGCRTHLRVGELRVCWSQWHHMDMGNMKMKFGWCQVGARGEFYGLNLDQFWSTKGEEEFFVGLVLWWFDEKNALFGDARNTIVVGVWKHWKLQGRIVARVSRDWRRSPPGGTYWTEANKVDFSVAQFSKY